MSVSNFADPTDALDPDNGIVRAVYKSGGPTEDRGYLDIGWDNVVYRLERDKPGFVPAAAAWSAFGDPRSGAVVTSSRTRRGTVGFVPDRATEVRRLRQKYANHDGDDTQFQDVPVVEVYDLQNNRLTTVLDDPSGQTVTAAVQTVAGHEQLLAIINRQQQMLAELYAAAGLADKADAVTGDVTAADLGYEEEPPPSGDLPEDTSEPGASNEFMQTQPPTEPT
jgi:hypothetical protein